MKRSPPRVSPEVAAVVLAADRVVDADLKAIRVWDGYADRHVDGPELAALRRAVLALRKKREEELKAVELTQEQKVANGIRRG